MFQRVEESLELEGTGVRMQGGLHPDLKMDYYENLLRAIKARYPQLHLHCLSAPEILNIAEICGITVREVISRLMDAGLDSIPGAGAEILDDEVRHRIARLKCSTEEWLMGHRTAHELGLRTTATMMFGCGEELRHRINHLERIRRIQEDTGGFTAFIPWMFAPENTPLGKKVPQATAVDYLKTLAVSRIYLDNIDHIQSSWLTPGIKVCQVGLQFGADDVGSILIEENVVRAAGVTRTSSEEQLRRLIADAGFSLRITGAKTWHGFAPYLGFSLGVANGSTVLEDNSGFTFKHPFQFGPHLGVRYYHASSVSLWVEGWDPMWRLRYPLSFFTAATGSTPVLDPSVQGPTQWVHNPTLLVGFGISLGS